MALDTAEDLYVALFHCLKEAVELRVLALDQESHVASVRSGEGIDRILAGRGP